MTLPLPHHASFWRLMNPQNHVEKPAHVRPNGNISTVRQQCTFPV